eukprot:TRINITY_DN2680_c0_g1_i1.p1 TRINITY_DN2680_c0_g1~~TRINITY_DN2680_c0_g1_i1.p1  ORF type:complete len:175 (+),score=34.72 TRINITY_DN2680_c0_g1_i1:65-589(+)
MHSLRRLISPSLYSATTSTSSLSLTRTIWSTMPNHVGRTTCIRYYTATVVQEAQPFISTPSGPGLIITDRCAERLNSIKEKDKNEALMLRIAVDSGGCSGFKYEIELDETVEDTDIVIERNGAKVVIDSESLKYLQGSKLDFTTEMIGSKFKIVENPLADKSCGCGTSFSSKIG